MRYYVLDRMLGETMHERDVLKAELAEAQQIAKNWRDAAERQKSMTDTADRCADGARDRAEKAKAEAAAMREALVAINLDDRNWDIAGHIDNALSQPGPGAALLERVKKLEAVAEVAGRFYREVRPNTYDPQKAHYDLGLALAALNSKDAT